MNHLEYKSKNCRGMTLLEITISTALLAIIIAATMVFLDSMSQAVSTELEYVNLTQTATRLAEDIAAELRDCKYDFTGDEWGFTMPATGSSSISFCVPVDWDDDGDVLDDDMNVEWGSKLAYVDLNGDAYEVIEDKSHDAAAPTTQTFFTTFRFVPSTELGNTVYSEINKGIDINKDGDKGDTFTIGHIEKVFSGGTAPDGTELDEIVIPKSENNILLVTEDTDDDDVYEDQFFYRNTAFSTTLRITIFMINTKARTPILVKASTWVNPQNME